MEDEEKKIENDISEDERETEESIVDEPRDSTSNDIAEDVREESESIDDLKRLIGEKDAYIKQLEKDLEEAHKTFLNTGRESEANIRDYNSIIKGVK